MAAPHTDFCSRHDEGICRAEDLTAGKWEIGLALADGETTVHIWHPEIMPDETIGILSPAQAVELGLALVTQGTRGLLQAGRSAW